jgi:hypothetical protein
VRDDLLKLGFKAQNIKLKGFAGADIYAAMGKRNTDLDLGVGMGWCGDWPLDPASTLRDVVNSAGALGIESPKYQRKLAAAMKLRGDAQYRALGKLDVEVMKELAPTVVLSTYNNRYFFSGSVNPKSLVYSNVYADWSIPALALK